MNGALTKSHGALGSLGTRRVATASKENERYPRVSHADNYDQREGSDGTYLAINSAESNGYHQATMVSAYKGLYGSRKHPNQTKKSRLLPQPLLSSLQVISHYFSFPLLRHPPDLVKAKDFCGREQGGLVKFGESLHRLVPGQRSYDGLTKGFRGCGREPLLPCPRPASPAAGEATMVLPRAFAAISVTSRNFVIICL
ncbi:hypothetical protein NL676_037237 [Syzygium grande]|nr:hypothetical protein NL676_037237 [Syzygium grande]